MDKINLENINDILPNEIIRIILMLTTYCHHMDKKDFRIYKMRNLKANLVCRKWFNLLNISLNLRLYCDCVGFDKVFFKFNELNNNIWMKPDELPMNENLLRNIRYVTISANNDHNIEHILNIIQSLNEIVQKLSRKYLLQIKIFLRSNESVLQERIINSTMFNDFNCFMLEDIIITYDKYFDVNNSMDIIKYLIKDQRQMKSIKFHGQPSQLVAEMIESDIFDSVRYSITKLEFHFESDKESINDSDYRLEQSILKFPNITSFNSRQSNYPNFQLISKWLYLVELKIHVQSKDSINLIDFNRWTGHLKSLKYFKLNLRCRYIPDSIIRSLKSLSIPNLVKFEISPTTIQLDYYTLSHMIQDTTWMKLLQLDFMFALDIPLISKEKIQHYREMFTTLMNVIQGKCWLWKLSGIGIFDLQENRSYQILKLLPECTDTIEVSYSEDIYQFINLNIIDKDLPLIDKEQFIEMIEIMNSMSTKSFTLMLEILGSKIDFDSQRIDKIKNQIEIFCQNVLDEIEITSDDTYLGTEVYLKWKLNNKRRTICLVITNRCSGMFPLCD